MALAEAVLQIAGAVRGKTSAATDDLLLLGGEVLPMSPGSLQVRIDEIVMPAIEEVDRVALRFRTRFVDLDERMMFAGELLLREALVNAVRHGSRGDPSKTVRFAARVKCGSLLIVVRDEGDGFDWRTALMARASAHENRGRGMEIFTTYANLIRFSPSGNQVALIRRQGPEGSEREQNR